jgi:hypothetical protein
VIDRVLLLLTDADDGQVVAAASTLTPGTWRVLCRRDSEALAGSHFQRLVPDQHPFDIAVDLVGADPAADLCALSPALDGSALLLAGRTVTFFGGPGSLGLLYFLARRASLPPAAFSDHWQHQHTTLPFPRLAGYRQFHVDVGATRDVAARCGLRAAPYDGVSEVGYADEAHVRRVSRDARVAEGAAVDERSFIDHQRSAVSLVEVVGGATAW